MLFAKITKENIFTAQEIGIVQIIIDDHIQNIIERRCRLLNNKVTLLVSSIAYNREKKYLSIGRQNQMSFPFL